MRRFLFFFIELSLVVFLPIYLNASEVFDASEVVEETHTKVIVREHPKTGKLYVSIVADNRLSNPDPFAAQRKQMKRPDYRMLDPKVRSGEIPYEGPYSSAKKVYIFAASLATLGVGGGAIGIAVAPAAATSATGAATASGGTYLAAGGAVAGTAAAAATITVKADPDRDDFIQISKSKSTALEKGDRQ